jgi:hypothetical protein
MITYLANYVKIKAEQQTPLLFITNSLMHDVVKIQHLSTAFGHTVGYSDEFT